MVRLQPTAGVPHKRPALRMRRLSIGMFVFCIMLFGLLWLVFDPIQDIMFSILNDVATDYGITSQELAYFGLLPLLIGVILVVYMILAVVRRNKE